MAKQIKKMPTPLFNISISPSLIGKAVQAKRTQSLLRLEDAAALCGVAKQTFMKVEQGSPTTQIATVLQICAGLGIEINIKPWKEEGDDSDEWQ